ncbi:hypothetical protein CAI16_02965 [Virgibacillus dokdonensis]|uniref:DUF3267 domain-containing protein n=1 Tax=Virgibacillus dokdonensis TaxID=302167 RepID=A0A3E0WVP1_9BACI|nr:hypothetical protein CAI16_02965 [Virgibacillus dokdonensis]
MKNRTIGKVSNWKSNTFKLLFYLLTLILSYSLLCLFVMLSPIKENSSKWMFVFQSILIIVIIVSVFLFRKKISYFHELCHHFSANLFYYPSKIILEEEKDINSNARCEFKYGEVIKRSHFLIIALAPAFVISIIFSILLFVLTILNLYIVALIAPIIFYFISTGFTLDIIMCIQVFLYTKKNEDLRYQGKIYWEII